MTVGKRREAIGARTVGMRVVPGAVLAGMMLVAPDVSVGAGQVADTIPSRPDAAPPGKDARPLGVTASAVRDSAPEFVQAKFGSTVPDRQAGSLQHAVLEPPIAISSVDVQQLSLEPPVLSELAIAQEEPGTNTAHLPLRSSQDLATRLEQAEERIDATSATMRAAAIATASAPSVDPVEFAEGADVSVPAASRFEGTRPAPPSGVQAPQFAGVEASAGSGRGPSSAIATQHDDSRSGDNGSLLSAGSHRIAGNADDFELAPVSLFEEPTGLLRDSISEVARNIEPATLASLPRVGSLSSRELEAFAVPRAVTFVPPAGESNESKTRASAPATPEPSTAATGQVSGFAASSPDPLAAMSTAIIGVEADESRSGKDAFRGPGPVEADAVRSAESTRSFVPTLKTSSLEGREARIAGFEDQVEFRSSMTTRIDGRVAGEVEFLQAGNSLSVKLGSVISLLEGRMDPAEFAKLQESSKSKEYVALETFQAAGIPISYDPVYDEFNIGSTEYRPESAHKVQIDQVGQGTRSADPIIIEQISR